MFKINYWLSGEAVRRLIFNIQAIQGIQGSSHQWRYLVCLVCLVWFLFYSDIE